MTAPRMTFEEVRAAAGAVNSLAYLTAVQDADLAMQLQLNGTYNGITAVPLSRQDAKAVIGFLMARHENLLVSLDVELPA